MHLHDRTARFAILAALMMVAAACSKAPNTEPAPGGTNAPVTPAPGGDAPKDDLALLQGTWAVEWIEYNGKKQTDSKEQFVFQDKTAILRHDPEDEDPDRAELRIDSSKSPKTIDLTFPEKDAKRNMIGIYELNGDHLKLCVSPADGGKRPVSFQTEAGTKTAVLSLKRAPNAPPYKEPDGVGYAEAIVGKWKLISGETNFAGLFSETEFTKDGRMLQLDFRTKEWKDVAKYRIEKLDLVISYPATAPGGAHERRFTLSRIGDELVSKKPSGKMKRIK